MTTAREPGRESVPSLYVRVYRSFAVNPFSSVGSLTIREGVSEAKRRFDDKQTVPSLYVRVYHIIGGRAETRISSLTIREGVSFVFELRLRRVVFPHYT